MFPGRSINAVMTVHASDIDEYRGVAISNNLTLGTGITQYASTNSVYEFTSSTDLRKGWAKKVADHFKKNPKNKNKETTAANKTIKDIVKQSLKRALPHKFFDKTTDEAVKCLRSLCIPEFKAKGYKIHFDANSEILEKIN